MPCARVAKDDRTRERVANQFIGANFLKVEVKFSKNSYQIPI
jgi:hypothetical protein